MKFLVIVGTAREGRNSIYPARKAEETFREKGHETAFYDLKKKNIPPLGNRTYMDEGPVPEDVQELSKEVKSSDGLVIVTPEYNHSIPGVLKNAMDYLYPEYDEKPFSFITVSGGGFGGVRALNHLHDIALEFNGFIGPSMPISNAGKVFSNEGELQEDKYRERFEEFVEDATEFVERVQK